MRDSQSQAAIMVQSNFSIRIKQMEETSLFCNYLDIFCNPQGIKTLVADTLIEQKNYQKIKLESLWEQNNTQKVVI